MQFSSQSCMKKILLFPSSTDLQLVQSCLKCHAFRLEFLSCYRNCVPVILLCVDNYLVVKVFCIDEHLCPYLFCIYFCIYLIFNFAIFIVGNPQYQSVQNLLKFQNSHKKQFSSIQNVKFSTFCHLNEPGSSVGNGILFSFQIQNMNNSKCRKGNWHH